MNTLPGSIPRGARLSAASVPISVIRSATEKLTELDIPVKQSTLIFAGLGSLIGMSDGDLREFVIAHTTPGRKAAASTVIHTERGQ